MRPICITLYNNSVLTVFNGLLASGNNELIPPHCLRFSLCMTLGNGQKLFYIFRFAALIARKVLRWREALNTHKCVSAVYPPENCLFCLQRDRVFSRRHWQLSICCAAALA
jgi:hypothetical protein